jgi:hypothetical protein
MPAKPVPEKTNVIKMPPIQKPDSVIDDLNTLLPEDAAVFRAMIYAAATKIRRARGEIDA